MEPAKVQFFSYYKREFFYVYFVSLLDLSSKSDWDGLLSLWFAIKTASILVIKHRPVFIIFKQREQLPGIHYQIEKQTHELLLEKKKNSLEGCICFFFLFPPLSPPFPQRHPHPPTPSLSRHGARCHSWYYLSSECGALHFANGLISCKGHPISPEIDPLSFLSSLTRFLSRLGPVNAAVAVCGAKYTCVTCEVL